MKLHILPPSANSHGCLAVIKKLNLDIEEVNAYGKTRTPEFLAMNPCHTCPCLELDGDDGAIWESSAIMRYLCVNNKGGEELYPNDPALRGKIDMVMDWRQTSLYKGIPPIAYIVFGMEQKDEDAKKSFANLLDEHFPVLLDVYLKDTPFCYSDKPTIADLAIAPTLTFLKCRKHFWAKVPEKVKDEDFVDMVDVLCESLDAALADEQDMQ